MSTSTLDRVGTGLAVLPCVNLLPPEITERKRIRRVQGICGGAAASAVAVVAALTLIASSGLNNAHHSLDAANVQQAKLQQQSTQFGDVTRVYTQAAQADQLIQAATKGEIHWTNFLNNLATTTPTNVWLTNVTVSAGTATPGTTAATTSTTTTAAPGNSAAAPSLPTLTFAGVALSHDDVAHWLDVMAAQPGLANPYLTKSDQQSLGGRDVYVFTITASVTAAALQSSAQGGN